MVYPNEAWPADSRVLAVDGTLDLATGLPFLAKGTGPTSSPSYEVQYNRRQMRENQILSGCRQGMVVDEGGLKIGVYPVLFRIDGCNRSFEGAGGVSVTDNASRVVYLDGSALLQVAAAWPAESSSYLPLATVTAVNGSLSIIDQRGWTTFQIPAAQYRQVSFGPAQVAANQNAVKVFEYHPPTGMVLEEVQLFCTAIASIASVSVRRSGVTTLCGPAAPVAGTVVKPVIADGNIAGADTLTVHVTSDSGGSVSNLTVLLVLRVA